jgi:hypothetical protein
MKFFEFFLKYMGKLSELEPEFWTSWSRATQKSTGYATLDDRELFKQILYLGHKRKQIIDCLRGKIC